MKITRPSWLTGRRAVLACVTVVAVLGATVFAAMGAEGSNYRTATATRGSVEQTVDFDGTIAASHRSDLTFATAGTVASVAVSDGDTVEAGAVLATLDPGDLESAVTRATAQLADAQAYLDDVVDGQIDTVTRSMSSTNPATSSVTSGNTTTVSAVYRTSVTISSAAASDSSDSDLQEELAALREQQEQVINAQTAATTAIAAARSALTLQQQACADTEESGSDDPLEDSGISHACQQALQAVQDAQDVVAEKQEALQEALETLSGTLQDAITRWQESAGGQGDGTSSTPGDPNADRPDADRTTPGRPSTGGTPGGTGSDGSGSRSATASDLARAQADVDTAKADLAQAEADLDAATLTAPHAGTVMAVDVTVGATVAAADRAFVLMGEGDTTARLSVPVDQLASIHVGQHARVTPGSGDPAAGVVSAIGLLPESSSGASSSVTYQVTVVVSDPIASPEGASVSVSLVTGESDGVVTVPTSAVTRSTATAGTVVVLVDGQATPTRVTLGAMSGTRIAVTEGIEEGDEVVLADLDAALPTSDTTGPGRSGSGAFGGGGFSGGSTGGFAGGGAPPPGR